MYEYIFVTLNNFNYMFNCIFKEIYMFQLQFFNVGHFNFSLKHNFAQFWRYVEFCKML
jgi:hypothetical protein